MCLRWRERLRLGILPALVTYAVSTAGVTPSLLNESPRREPKGIRVVFYHRGILSAYASGFQTGRPKPVRAS